MSKFSRRMMLNAAAALPLAAKSTEPKFSDASIYAKVGAKPVINGMGTVTVLGGSIMPAEVVKAMEEASRYFVRMPELKEKVGAKLAEILNVPAAMVTTGAAGAIAVGTAACMACGDAKRVGKLPRLEGMRTEVVQQKSHRSGYEAQIELCGARIVQVETLEELNRAIGDRTAMLFFLNKAESHGKINREQWIAIGKKRKVPTFNDAAADVPGKDRLTGLVKQGFDLVCFSGGKGLLGPQSTGLLLGNKDLVAAAQAVISPNAGIGRGMKVGKEEMMGLLAAVERYLKVDHDAEFKMLDGRVSEMIKTLSAVKGVQARREVPQIANEVPHLVVHWSSEIKVRDLTRQLEEGDPSIWVLPRGGEKSVMVSVWMMRGAEHRLVARRLKEILEKG